MTTERFNVSAVKNIGPMTNNLEVESSYVEDGKELNILTSMPISLDTKQAILRHTGRSSPICRCATSLMRVVQNNCGGILIRQFDELNATSY